MVTSTFPTYRVMWVLPALNKMSVPDCISVGFHPRLGLRTNERKLLSEECFHSAFQKQAPDWYPPAWKEDIVRYHMQSRNVPLWVSCPYLTSGLSIRISFTEELLSSSLLPNAESHTLSEIGFNTNSTTVFLYVLLAIYIWPLINDLWRERRITSSPCRTGLTQSQLIQNLHCFTRISGIQQTSSAGPVNNFFWLCSTRSLAQFFQCCFHSSSSHKQ